MNKYWSILYARPVDPTNVHAEIVPGRAAKEVVVHISFRHQVPVSLSLEEIEVLLRCLSRCDELEGSVNCVIARQLEERLASVRGDLVKKMVGVKY